MENTLFLAQFLGIFSIILSIVVILRRKMMVRVVTDFLRNRTLAFIVGLLETLFGLLLVLKHFEWNTPLEVVISLLGMLFLLEGIFYLSATKGFMRKMIGMLDNQSAYYFFSVLYLVFGIYLTIVGFGLGM